jgi:hypothetical protein
MNCQSALLGRMKPQGTSSFRLSATAALVALIVVAVVAAAYLTSNPRKGDSIDSDTTTAPLAATGHSSTTSSLGNGNASAATSADTSKISSASSSSSTIVTSTTSWVPNYTASSSAGVPGLRLELQVYTNSSGYLSIRVDEFNFLATMNNVTTEGDWSNVGFSAIRTVVVGSSSNSTPAPSVLNPYYGCPVTGPVGLAVLPGDYNSTDYESGNPLTLYGPEGFSLCGNISLSVDHYEFPSMSSNGIGLDSQGSYPYMQGSSLSFSSYGFWTGGITIPISPSGAPDTFVPFSASSTYTVLAADEWGRVVTVSFTLTGSSSTAQLTADICHPASDGDVFLRLLGTQSMTIPINHYGEYFGNFYCGGGGYNVTLSQSDGYVKVSGLDGQPTTGVYYPLVQVGTDIIQDYINAPPPGKNATVYATLIGASANVTTITCYPDSPCAARTAPVQ